MDMSYEATGSVSAYEFGKSYMFFFFFLNCIV